MPAPIALALLAAGGLYLATREKKGDAPKTARGDLEARINASSSPGELRALAAEADRLPAPDLAARARDAAARLEAGAAAAAAVQTAAAQQGGQVTPGPQGGAVDAADDARQKSALVLGAQLVDDPRAWDANVTAEQRNSLVVSAITPNPAGGWLATLRSVAATRDTLPKSSLSLERIVLVRSGLTYAAAGLAPHPGIATRIDGYPYPDGSGNAPPAAAHTVEIPPPGPASSSSSSSSAPLVYTVKRGDYADKVARAFTGTGGPPRVKELAAKNPAIRQRILKGVAMVGDRWTIPGNWLDARDGRPIAMVLAEGGTPQPGRA